MTAQSALSVAVVALLCGLCAAEMGYFFQLSDTHMQMDYKVNSDPAKFCYAGKGNAGRFGDYNCRSPYPVEHSAVQMIPTLRPNECANKNPMFILWTGDSAAKYGDKFSKDIIKKELTNITHLLKNLQNSFSGSKVPIYPVLGNHDAYPQHQLPGSEYWVYDTAESLWKEWLPEHSLNTLKKHGYYFVNVNSKLRLIVLNTVLYYVNNQKCSKEKDPGGQFEWLREKLKDAKAAGQVVYIAGHIPLRGSGGCFQKHFESKFLDAMKGYHHIIMGSFWGHCHIDAFQLYGNTTSGDFHVAHLASTMGSDGHRNPSFRWYMFDSDKNYAIHDWKTFAMDLNGSNTAGKPLWKTVYNARDKYDIGNASATSMLALVKKMQSNPALVQTAHSLMHAGGPISSCDATCQKQFLCAVMHPTTNGYDKCIK